MNYESVKSYQSKLVPGVSFELRKMSHQRRVKLSADAASVYAEIAELQRQVKTIGEEIERAVAEAKTEPCQCPKSDTGGTLQGHEHNDETWQCLAPGCPCRVPKTDPAIGGIAKRAEVDNKIFEVIVDRLYPEYLKWGVKSIDGLTIDGAPATVQSLLESGPEPLLAEVGSAIDRIVNMSVEEILGFKSPTTSDAPVGGQTPSTTASPASETKVTGTESA